MTANKSTSNTPQLPARTINDALNSRWKYFKSLHGSILAACFDSDSLSANPNFVQIDRQTYFELAEKMQS